MKEKVYLAGPLFSKADQNQRVLEYNQMKDEVGEKVDLFCPLLAPINNKSTLPTAEQIYTTDEKELLESRYVFADLAYYDAGVCFELGLVQNQDNVTVYAYDSDLRVSTAGEYKGLRVPYGVNQFVIGGLLKKHKLFNSFDEALTQFKLDLEVK